MKPRMRVLLFLMPVVCAMGPGNPFAQSTSGGPTVVTVHPRSGDFSEPLKLPGSFEAFEVAKLYAKITGYLEKIHVDLGDEVKKGQILAELAIPEMEPELDVAKAEKDAAAARLEKAKADTELASLTYKRVKELHTSEPGAITQQDVDVAAVELKVAGAQESIAGAEVRLAAARIARLETLMEYAKIRAPFHGRVTRRFVHTGVLIKGEDTSGEPIVEVVRTDRLRLAIELPEIVVPHVQKGHKVGIVIDALPGQSFQGRIKRLSAALMASTRNRRAEVELDRHDGRLLPGMYATVHLDFRTFPGALSLPAAAIHKVQGVTSVYVVAKDVLQRVSIAVLMDNGKNVVVSGDLEPNTQVVVSKPRLVEEGAKVQARPLNGASK